MPRRPPLPDETVLRRLGVVSRPVPVGWTPPELPEAIGEPEPPREPAPDAGPARARLAQLLPEPLQGGRWDPGRHGLLALIAVAATAAALALLLLVRGRPHEIAAPPVVGGASASTPAARGEVVVDVDGKVRRPGIVRLPLGSRVDDAVRAAGGALPGTSLAGLNLARKLADGEQVLVGAAAPAGGVPGASAAGVDLNAADVAALDALPGIGPVLAQHIVDWRTEHGRFASIDQLREVPGIGESKFAAVKTKVRV